LPLAGPRVGNLAPAREVVHDKDRTFAGTLEPLVLQRFGRAALVKLNWPIFSIAGKPPWARPTPSSASSAVLDGNQLFRLAASLAGRRLTLQLDQDELEWLGAHIFRQVLSTGIPLGRPSLRGGLSALSVGQRESCLTISQEYGNAGGVLMHH
jgi:hypothetical protein